MIVIAIPLLIGELLGVIGANNCAEMNRDFMGLFGMEGGWGENPTIIRAVSSVAFVASIAMIVLHFTIGN